MRFGGFLSGAKHLAGVVVLVLGLGNCAAPSLKPPVVKLSRPPIFSARQIFDHLTKQPLQIKNCRVFANLKVDSWGTKRSVNTVMVLESPESLRLEFLSFLGNPMQFLVCHQGSFWFYSPSQVQVMTGAATRFNLYRLLGINMELRDIIDVLLARPTLLKTLSPVLIQYLGDENKYLVQLSDLETKQEQTILLDAVTLVPLELTVRQQQQVNLHVNWDDYTAVGKYFLPAKIYIERPLEDTRVLISYSDASLNQEIAADMFSLNIPEHAEWTELPPSTPAQ